MTIAITLKVGDGVVLGTDSAGTLMNPTVRREENVYFTSEKLLNVYCGLPVALATFGLGGLGGISITRLARDLRAEMSSANAARYVNPKEYSVEQIAQHVLEFFQERYYAAFGDDPKGPTLGFHVAGYSSGQRSSEVFKVTVGGSAVGIESVFGRQETDGLVWDGVVEPLMRLIRGWAPALPDQLVAAGVDAPLTARDFDVVAPLWHPAMPLMDAITLVRYLAEVTAGFVRYAPGPQTVAAPIDIAAITKHEGFRWVSRKHYFSQDLNPSEKYTKPPAGKEVDDA